MHLFPELAFAADCFRQNLEPETEGGWSSSQLRNWARYSLEASGKTQWSTFRQLEGIAMSAKARRRAQELERKFAGQQPERPDGMRTLYGHSPIPADKAKKMTDGAWRSALRKDWSKYRIGGASELSRALEAEAPAELDGLVLELVQLAARKLTAASANVGSLAYRLWEPLMRLYTSNENDLAIRHRCLDVIDTLVALDVVGSEKLFEASR